ncbi:MAG: hypothetical protein CME65_12115 [Halobacteriovoraceae bacterium]|nr:hypothetical protein [Halobacteriovoraceae bacterium]|tara:strand:- start:17739 stop:18965 length:1227 start_codon:yes stop_codon:yes gene_type:complete
MREIKLKELLHSDFQEYKLIEGLPCLYLDQDETLASWSIKINSYIKEEETHIKSLQFKINQTESKNSKKRLNDQLQARVFNLKQFKKILKGFFKETGTQTIFSSQQIHSYFENIFRDWAWGKDELEAHIDELIKTDLNNKTVLILGAGAGGLSFNLAKKFPDSFFVDIEHNPLLACVNEKLCQGQSLKLIEYTPYPKELISTSQKHELKGEVLENKTTILATFPDLPFKEHSFDIIIAPWFLDILDIPFENALFCAKDFLKEEGVFLFCGPTNIHKKVITEQYCFEEIEDIFKEHFKEVKGHSKSIPYLASPLSSQTRIENVAFFESFGLKSSELSLKATTQIFDLPYTPEFEQYKSLQIVKAQILSHITKDINVDDLALILESKFNLSHQESRPYAQKFLDKIKFEY